MNKIVEEVSRALCRLRVNKDDYVDEQWLCFTHDAYAAIACIADGDLDPKGLDKAIDVVLDVFDKEPTTSEYAESIIRAYLKALGDSNE